MGDYGTEWIGNVVKIADIDGAAMIAATSFEERSSVSVNRFLSSGGRTEAVFLANVVESGPSYQRQLLEFTKLGIDSAKVVDRFSSRSLWLWCSDVVEQAAQIKPNLVIDVTCMPKELLGMLLFAVWVRRECFPKVFISYVAAPSEGYATQNPKLAEDDRWLSKGVTAVRSVVGYPGAFRGDRPTHLIALAGHELERLFAITEYVEPSRLTIGGAEESSSTVSGAGVLSQKVAEELKNRIQVPDIGDISFSATSIENVVAALRRLKFDVSAENVALVAMNTKLAFVGAALFLLANRDVRMVYAVPREYNPLYCVGVGKEYCVEITTMLRASSG